MLDGMERIFNTRRKKTAGRLDGKGGGEREGAGGNLFLLMKCQVDCLRQMEGAEQMDVSGDIDSMQKILKAICKFCREHGCNEYRMDSGQSVKPAAI